MRSLRLVLYFLIGLLLGGAASLSVAAIAPTPAGTIIPWAGTGLPVVFNTGTFQAMCQEMATGTDYHVVNVMQIAQKIAVPGTHSSASGGGSVAANGGNCNIGGTSYHVGFLSYACPSGTTSQAEAGGTGRRVCATTAATCPANSTLSGGACVCNSNFVEQGNACVVNTCPTSGSVFLSAANATPVSSGCFNGCNVFVKSADNGWYVPSTGQRIFAGTFEYTGLTCTANNLATNNTASQCAAGTCPGTVNGVSTCLPCSASNPLNSVTKAKETTTKTDGTSSSTDATTSTTNNGGSVSTTTTTTINNTNAAGATTTETKQSTDEKPTNEFCKENPNTPMCKTSSFGGTCSAFTCDGDAVQCAIAKDQHARNCALFDTATPLSTLGAAVASGADPSASTLPNPLNPSVVNLPSQFDQTDVMGGACISDTVFTVRGQSLSIPWSSLCSYLSIMGSVMVALSMLVGLRISLGGVA